MGKQLIILIAFAALQLTTLGNPQKNAADSLAQHLKTATEDSAKVNNCIYLASYFFEKNLKKSNYFAQQALLISQNIKYRNGQAKSLFLLAQTEHKLGKLKSALTHFGESTRIFQQEQQSYFQGKGYAEMGNVYADLGEMVSAIKYHQTAIEVFKKLNNQIGIGNCYSDLGHINHMQKNYNQSLTYYQKAKNIFAKAKDEMALANLYNRVSVVFRDQQEIEKSLSYDYKALLIQEKLRDKSGMATSNLNIGETSIIQQEFTRSQGYIDYAAKLFREIEDQIGLSKCYLLSAQVALLQNKTQIAAQNLIKCIEIAEKARAIPQLVDSYKLLSDLSAQNNNIEEAYKYLAQHGALKDTLYSLERSRQFSEMEVKYQTETIEEQLEVEKLEKENEANKAFTFTLSFFLGSGIFVIILLLMRKKNKESAEINRNLERKNELIEKKNNEILDSIVYAKRIQEAMLTSADYLDKIFDDFFVLYKPKDIVSGDFYWAYHSNTTNNVFWATADCTGHGVPGALMSMIGTVLLNEVVIIKKVDSTAKILSQINAYLKRYLNNGDSLYQSQDGMDISCCKLDRSTMTIEVSGATHSVYVMRQGVLTELKGDKITLGQDPFSRKINNFSITQYQLQKNDIIYTFTDGYPDQIGGENRKKLKVGVLKKYLTEISTLPLQQQKNNLKEKLTHWQGENPQLDDVLIMGVKV